MTFASNRAALSLAAALYLIPVQVAAQSSRAAGGTMCACPGMAKPLGSAPNCQVACYGSSSGGGGSSANAELGKAIGSGLVEMMKQSAAKSAAAKAARARQAEIDRQRLQEQQSIEDEARKDRLLSGMQGVEGGELTLMTGDEPIPESRSSIAARARDRHNQEAALRRAALARLEGKPEAQWCKLHLPQALAMPQRSAGEERVYSEMMQKFARDRSEWDIRCGGPSAEGPTPLDSDLAALQRFEKPKLVPIAGATPTTTPSVTSAPQAAAESSAPRLQAGGLSLMNDDDLPRAAPKKEPAPGPAPAVESPARAPAVEPQRNGWTATSVEAKAPHVVAADTPGMPPPVEAPVFPAAPVAGKNAVTPLSFAAAPAVPGAYAFMSRAPAPSRERAQQSSRGNEKPKFELLMFTKGLASVEDGVALAAASIRVLYNLGAVPSETVESKTVLVYEKDEADKGAFETEKGLAILPAGSIEWKALTAESIGPNRWLRAGAPAGVKR